MNYHYDVDLAKPIIQKEPIYPEWGFVGDKVFATYNNNGEGIIVGFSSYTGEPHVFFYSRQKVLCIGHEELEHINV